MLKITFQLLPPFKSCKATHSDLGSTTICSKGVLDVVLQLKNLERRESRVSFGEDRERRSKLYSRLGVDEIRSRIGSGIEDGVEGTRTSAEYAEWKRVRSQRVQTIEVKE